MAKRYGGKFSPDGQTRTEHVPNPRNDAGHAGRNSFDGASPDAAGARSNVRRCIWPPSALIR